MALDDPQQATGAPVSTTESTNAGMLNQAMGAVLETLNSNSSALIAKLNAIASAITSSIFGGNVGATANRIVTSKGTSGLVLQGSGASVDASGNINTNGGDLTVDDITADTGAFATGLTKGGANVAIVTQTICASFTFAFPENGTVNLILNQQFAWTITLTVVITEAGTATVQVLNNGSGITSNSASTSRSSVAQNSAVAGNSDIAVTFSSVSSTCENLCLTIWGTRVLAS